MRAEAEQQRRQKLEEETKLRDSLMESVKQLQQRKQDIQRELLQRTLPTDKGKIKSTVTVPKLQ